jgi:hypothetical protein
MRLSFFYILITFSKLNSQVTSNESVDGLSLKEGSYQIQISDPKKQPIYFTNESLIYFESLRLSKKSFVFKINEKTTIFLPSKNEIENKNFKPLIPTIFIE